MGMIRALLLAYAAYRFYRWTQMPARHDYNKYTYRTADKPARRMAY